MVQFDPRVATAWLVDPTGPTASGLPMCSAHAERFKAPMGWTVADERSPPSPSSAADPATNGAQPASASVAAEPRADGESRAEDPVGAPAGAAPESTTAQSASLPVDVTEPSNDWVVAASADDAAPRGEGATLELLAVAQYEPSEAAIPGAAIPGAAKPGAATSGAATSGAATPEVSTSQAATPEADDDEVPFAPLLTRAFRVTAQTLT